jgi:hypothetical protein
MADISWGELNDTVVTFARRSARFREALLTDPKRILSGQIGQQLPDFLKVRVLRETADTVYLVLPFDPPDGDELTDEDLDAVCGGAGRSSSVTRGVSPLRGGDGDQGGGGGDPGFECQTFGGGNQGTFNEIDTELSVF